MEKKKPYLHKPITRRDFMSQGLIEASHIAVIPSLLSMVHSKLLAAADICPVRPTGAPEMAHIVIDCMGGYPFATDIVVKDAGGMPLSKYNLLGQGNGPYVFDGAAAEQKLGGLTFFQSSKVLEGIREQIALQVANPINPNRIVGAIAVAPSTDDSKVNMFNSALLVGQASKGLYFSRPLGTENSISGGGSRSAIETQDVRAIPVRDAAALKSLVSFSTQVVSELSKPRQEKLLSAIERFNATQASKKWSERLYTDEAQFFMKCGLSELRGNVAADVAAKLDPLASADARAIFEYSTLNTNARVAGLVLAALNGYAPSVTIGVGACDSHDGGVATTRAKGMEIGRLVGKIVRLAHVMNKSVMLHLITDGSMLSANGGPEWVSDRGRAGVSVILAYKQSQISVVRSQIGSFNSEQAVDSTNRFAVQTSDVAYWALVNYLSLVGRLSDASKYLPSSINGTTIDLWRCLG